MKYGKICLRHPELNGLRHNGSNCKACLKEAKKEYIANNNDKVRASQRRYCRENIDRVKELNAKWRAANKDKIRENNLRRMGFTTALFADALEMQDGRCAICEVQLASLPTKQVHADHCHTTGLARGVLCHHCNAGLGAFRDSPERLRRAIEYLSLPTLGLL